MWEWFVVFFVLLILLLYCTKFPKKDEFPKLESNELVHLKSVAEQQNDLFHKKGYHDRKYFHNTVYCPADCIYIKRFGNVFELIKENEVLFSTKNIPDIVDNCWSNHCMVVLLCRHNSEKHSLKLYNFKHELLFMTEPFLFENGIWFLNNGFFCLGVFSIAIELRYYNLDDYKGYLIKSYSELSDISILPLLDKDEAILSDLTSHKVELISHNQIEKVLRLLSSENMTICGIRNENYYSFDDEMHQIVISNVVMISKIFHLDPPIVKGRITNAILYDTHLIAIIWQSAHESCISIFDEDLESTVNVIKSCVVYNGAFIDVPIIEIKSFGYGFFYKVEYIHIPPLIFKYEKDMASITMEIPMDIELEYVNCYLNDFKILLICPKSFNILKKHYVHVILSNDKRYNACQSVDFIRERQGLVIYFDTSLLHSRNMTLYLQYYKQLLLFLQELSCYEQAKTTFYAEGLGASLVAMNLNDDACQYTLKNGTYLFENDLIMQSPLNLIFSVKSVILVIGTDEITLKYLLHLQEHCPRAYGLLK
eukprot:NODE_334_length_10694_cov_0.301180.p2 type:complete len:537 gc:universal NODE_334_length_10694_cov_0.301180:7987-9597(+)